MIAVKKTPANNALWPFEELCKYFDIKDRRKYVYGLILGKITPPENVTEEEHVYIYSRWGLEGDGTTKNEKAFLGYIVAQGYTQPPMLEGPDEDGEYLELMEDLDGNCIAGVVFVELLKPITKDGNGVLWCGTEKLSDLYGSYYKSEKFEVGNSFNVLPLYRLKPKNWELLDPIAYEVSPVSWKEFGDLAGGYGTISWGDATNFINTWGEAMMLGEGWKS